MRSLVSSLCASLALAALAPTAGEAFGRRGGCREYSCAPACAAPCVVVAAPAVTYVERKVTYLKPVWKEKVVEETIVRCVPRPEKFVYEVNVPVTEQEKRMVKVAKPVMKEESFTRRVAFPVHGVEKRKVISYQPIFKEVEFTYSVPVMKYRDVKRTVHYCDWETKAVEATVPVCRVIPETCVDSCGRCYTVCRRVTEYVKVVRNVNVPIPRSKEIVVKECYYESEARKGVKKVCHYQAVENVVEVPVCHYEYKDVPATRMVCHTVWEDREVTVPVCRWVKEKREGVRTVVDRVPEKVTRKVRYCDYEQVTDVVRVPVYTPCYTTSSDCGRGGLFGRFRRGCDY